MPKAIIYCAPEHLRSSDSSQALAVEVGWSKGTPGAHVTVAAYDRPTEGTSGPVPFALKHAVEVPLNRSGVNRLIRALRQARDQAFGTDA